MIESPLSVFDRNGEPVGLENLWTETPAVIAFVRHFG